MTTAPRRGSAGAYGYITTESTLVVNHDTTEFSTSYDYCIVFKMRGTNHTHQSKHAKFALHAMLEAGLEVFPYLSVQDDELMVLVRVPPEKLREFADKINFKMRIDPAHLEATIRNGDPEKRIKPRDITNDQNITPYTPYEYIYLEYGRHHDPKLYYVPPGYPDAFVPSIRLKLTYLLLRAPRRDGGCGLELSNWLHKKKVLALFPLHDKAHARAIQHKIWETSVLPWNVPLEDIREYFGEKIALYNVFIGHYALWLWAPALIGLAFQLVVWGTGPNFSSPVLPFYSLVVTVWSVVMLEYWKQKQATTAMFWGMSDFEQLEQERPEFVGTLIKSYINGDEMLYYPPNQARQFAALARVVVGCFIAIVVGVVAAIYTFRFYLQTRNGSVGAAASTIASILNTVQIQVFNLIYQYTARKLTDMENLRTDTEYEDALIVKLFVFQFINSYASFFFLAFIAGNLARPNNVPINYLGQCGATNCMEPLSINLAIIFGTRLTLGNFLDIFIPYVSHKSKIRTETKGVAKDKLVTAPEKDYMLLNYETMIESINNYADTAVQYGFTLLFITALPVASLCSLVSCYFKVKFNAWKLCTFYQRPIPQGAQDIGTWLTIFQIISVASVITNAGLICFTMTVLWQYSLQGRVWIFIGFQWVLISLQFLLQAVISDTPEDVEIQMKRMEFFQDKVIEKVEDEDYGQEQTQLEVEDEADEEEKEENQAQEKPGCCSCGMTSKKTVRVKNLPNEYQARPYPTETSSAAWPAPLGVADDTNQSTSSKSPRPSKDAAGTPKSQFTNYASHGAVPSEKAAGKDAGEVRNPAFAESKK